MTTDRSGSPRKCNTCGRAFVPRAPHHWRCDDCQRLARELAPPGGDGRPMGGDPRAFGRSGDALPPEYLKDGYFDAKGNLWPSLLLEDARVVAERLGADRNLSATQLRRFFNKVRLVERRLDAGGDFAAAVPEIASLGPLAAYAVGRQSANELFKQFVDRNVDLAMRDERSFRKGFLAHFESVICYFKYRYPKQ